MEVRQEREQSRAGLSALTTRGQTQSVKLEHLLNPHGRNRRACQVGTLHFWYTGWNFKSMRTKTFPESGGLRCSIEKISGGDDILMYMNIRKYIC